ncbi:hypothetical protein HMPREF9997_02691 [Corynebacterium durum F0235]|uniref:Uncharacterized protein n=1 Tax=Corynebacterium durum F0235 TaxID=1035195 RepID=L1M8K7_9CORY|nr:hypothetical protein HMPREF9997_02691 [Corynebacterium durum F0235]
MLLCVVFSMAGLNHMFYRVGCATKRGNRARFYYVTNEGDT